MLALIITARQHGPPRLFVRRSGIPVLRLRLHTGYRGNKRNGRNECYGRNERNECYEYVARMERSAIRVWTSPAPPGGPS